MTQLEWLRYVAKCVNEACAILERENARPMPPTPTLQEYVNLRTIAAESAKKQGTPF